MPVTSNQLSVGAKRRAAGNAFTLIELLAVIAIVIIMTGIAIVSYLGTVKAAAMSSAANHLRSSLMLARQNAMLNGRRTCVVLQSDRHVVVEQHGRGIATNSLIMDEYADDDLLVSLESALGAETNNIYLYNLEAGANARRAIITGVLPAQHTILTGSPDGGGTHLWPIGGLSRYGFEMTPEIAMPRRIRMGDGQTTGDVHDSIMFHPDGGTRDPNGREFSIYDENKTDAGDPCILFSIAPLTGFIGVEDSTLN